jgi:ribosomal protein S30
MLANVLTCLGTGGLGVGVGLVLNTIRAKRAKGSKRKIGDVESETPQTQAKLSKGTNPTPKNLLLAYGFQSYFDTLNKYILERDKEEYHAYVSLRKHVRRILELAEKSEEDATKSKFWNPGGAIAANATKVKLWVRTLNHMFEDRIGENFPEELVEALQFILDYINMEQYNKLMELGS